MKEIKDFTDIELKAIAYDTMLQVQQLQNQLAAINAELMKRNTLKKEE